MKSTFAFYNNNNKKKSIARCTTYKATNGLETPVLAGCVLSVRSFFLPFLFFFLPPDENDYGGDDRGQEDEAAEDAKRDNAPLKSIKSDIFFFCFICGKWHSFF